MKWHAIPLDLIAIVALLLWAIGWLCTVGLYLRITDPIGYGEFRHKFAKFVRKGHVQTVKHWMHGQPIERNVLKVTA